MTLLPMRQSWPTWELARKVQRSPTMVSMPPPSVPGFMVTPSRIRQSLPMRERGGLALVLEVLRLVPDRGEREDARARADAGAPGHHHVAHQLDALAQRRPRCVTWQKGPMRTPSASARPVLHDGGGVDLRFSGIVPIQDHGAHLGLRHHLAVDLGLAVEAPGAAAAADLLHVVVQLVSRQHGLAELGAVDAHEVDELRLVGGIRGDARTARRRSAPAPRRSARPASPESPGNAPGRTAR